MILDKIKEFFKKIFKRNNTKFIAEKSESNKMADETNKEFVEKIDLKELHKNNRIEIDNRYDIENKDDFFIVYNLVKEDKISLDSLSMKWVIKIDLMMQEEIDMLQSSNEAA